MIKVEKIATKPPKKANKSDYKKPMKKLLEKLADLQYLMQAEGKHSLLIVLQGMDASGKDGITKKVFGACSPSGINVYAFKKPTDEEFAHDFLWRVHKQAPQKGMVKLFSLNNLSIANRTSLFGILTLKLSLIVKATLKVKALSPKSVNVTPGAGLLNTNFDEFAASNNNFFTNSKSLP